MGPGPGEFPRVKRSLHELPDDTLLALGPTARLAAAGELAAGVVHELNNPLFAILGLADLCLADAEPGSRPAERLELVRSTGLEMRETIRALRDFVRGRAHEPGPADLAGSARAAVDLFRRTSAARRLRLEERYPPEPVPVAGDPAGLEQIVLQLLLEARRAAGEEGAVAVELTRERDEALLRVREDGAEPRPEVGLGLLVARVLARDRGGSLEAETPGTMLLRLPSP
jgi:two-component system NtrC family sensor kinase